MVSKVLPIDWIAYTHPWRQVPSGAKFVFLIGGIFSLHLLPNSTLWVVGILYILLAFIVVTRTPRGWWHSYGIWSLSLIAFIVVSSMALPLSLSFDKGLFLTWSREQAPYAFKTGFRSICGMQLAIAYSLCTPMDDTLKVLKKCHAPVLLLELMAVGYRFIGVLWETAGQMHLALKLRSGGCGKRQELQNLALVIVALMATVQDKAMQYELAEKLRLGGRLAFIEDMEMGDKQ